MKRFFSCSARLVRLRLILVVAALSLLTSLPAAAFTHDILVVRTPAKAYRFNVEIADNADDRAQGLMFRKDMANYAGMLFLYPQDQAVTFWMKNTYLPLDMIFIAADGRITQIVKNARPLSESLIPSDSYVRGVLEVNAGITDQLGIRVGDQIDYKAFKLSSGTSGGIVGSTPGGTANQ